VCPRRAAFTVLLSAADHGSPRNCLQHSVTSVAPWHELYVAWAGDGHDLEEWLEAEAPAKPMESAPDLKEVKNAAASIGEHLPPEVRRDRKQISWSYSANSSWNAPVTQGTACLAKLWKSFRRSETERGGW
jgi:hypothetical protein